MQPAKALGQSPRVDAVETIDGLGVLDGEIEQLLSVELVAALLDEKRVACEVS